MKISVLFVERKRFGMFFMSLTFETERKVSGVSLLSIHSPIYWVGRTGKKDPHVQCRTNDGMDGIFHLPHRFWFVDGSKNGRTLTHWWVVGKYCWWFRNPVNQLRLVVLSHCLQGFIHPRWWSPDFGTINGISVPNISSCNPQSSVHIPSGGRERSRWIWQEGLSSCLVADGNEWKWCCVRNLS